MTWTKLSDDFNERADLMDLSRSARLLYVEMYVFANRLLLDGTIPRRQVRKFTDADDPDTDLKELVEAGVVEVDGDNLVIDWSDQELREDVDARRTYRAEVQAKYRKRKDAHARGDHSLCDARYCKSGVTGNESSNKAGYETPSRPVPSRPVRRTGDRDGGTAGFAGATPADHQQAKDAWLRVECTHGVVGGAWTEYRRCDSCYSIAHNKIDGLGQTDELVISDARLTLDLLPAEADWYADRAPENYEAARTVAFAFYDAAIEKNLAEPDIDLRGRLVRRMFTYLEALEPDRDVYCYDHCIRPAESDPTRCVVCDKAAESHISYEVAA